MPKRSDDSLLASAIPAAILDRESFAEAYHNVGPEADEAFELVGAIRRLGKKKLSELSHAERECARLCFIYAEQYEQSRADARVEAGRSWETDPARKAASFKELRMRLWGKTRLEADMASARTVSMCDLANSNLKFRAKI